MPGSWALPYVSTHFTVGLNLGYFESALRRNPGSQTWHSRRILSSPRGDMMRAGAVAARENYDARTPSSCSVHAGASALAASVGEIPVAPEPPNLLQTDARAKSTRVETRMLVEHLDAKRRRDTVGAAV